MATFENLNVQYHSQNAQLVGRVAELQDQEKRISHASQLLSGGIRSLREVREKQKDLLRRTFAVVRDRKAIAASEEELRTAENEAEIEWQRDEATARIRAHFQDAGAADRVVDRKEFPGLIRALRELPSLGSSFDLSFDAFRGGSVSGDSDMDQDAITRTEFMIKIIPIVARYFDGAIARAREAGQKRLKETHMAFEAVEAELKERKIIE